MSKTNTKVEATETKEIKDAQETNVNVEGFKKENKVVGWVKKHAKPLVGAGLAAAGVVVGLAKLASSVAPTNDTTTEDVMDPSEE